MAKEYLDFMKNLIEGNAQISFRSWFFKEQGNLKAWLPNAKFLRLKFDPMQEIPKILKENGVIFSLNETAIRAENYYLLFDDAMLDEKGRINDSVKRKLFDGLVAEIIDNNNNLAEELLVGKLRRLKKTSSAKRREELEGLLYFAETEIVFGDHRVGVVLIDLLEKHATDFDEIYDLVLRAKKQK